MAAVVDDAVLEQLVQRIVDAVQPERIILFGSQVSGKVHEDSDVDLLVIVPEPFGAHRSRIKEMGRLAVLLIDFPVAKDVLIYSSDEFEEFSQVRNHIIATAAAEGRVVYDRSRHSENTSR